MQEDSDTTVGEQVDYTSTTFTITHRKLASKDVIDRRYH
jgi:hypothetical protein